MNRFDCTYFKGLFDATIVGNVFALRVDAVNLNANPLKHCGKEVHRNVSKLTLRPFSGTV